MMSYHHEGSVEPDPEDAHKKPLEECEHDKIDIDAELLKATFIDEGTTIVQKRLVLSLSCKHCGRPFLFSLGSPAVSKLSLPVHVDPNAPGGNVALN